MDYQQRDPQPSSPPQRSPQAKETERTLLERFIIFWRTLGFNDVLLFRVGALAFIGLDYFFGQSFWKHFPQMIGADEPLPGVVAGAFQIGFSAVQILLLRQIINLFRRVVTGAKEGDWEHFAWFVFAVLILLFSFGVNVYSNVVALRTSTSNTVNYELTFEETSMAWSSAAGTLRWVWAGGALLISVLGELLWDLAGIVAEGHVDSKSARP